MKVTLDRYIEITPDIRGGKPRIAGRRITVADVAIAYLRLGQSLEEVAAEYDLTLSEVYAAMSFYYDNKVAIDESIQASETFADSLRSLYPSLLQEKIKMLKDVRTNSLPS
ncbi:MAG: hypothetical protein DCF19_04775 [Pseudanabaena frigida]|uniref:DUF433 domain-containing protein n=1 Tax=Pseudanabaena frigida TaxID=945775 RepID=A0A2W4WFF0_9CYAN|nr:MAG: hypothetical protein DCF19_04775 [Pseudanabaena frigida]